MIDVEEKFYSKAKAGKVIVSVDIGGTRTNIAVFQFFASKKKILLTHDYKSNDIKNFNLFFPAALTLIEHKIGKRINSVSIAVSGPISKNGKFCKPTNLSWNVDTVKLAKSGIKKILLVNDFEALAAGIDSLSSNKLVKIKSGDKRKEAPRVLLGAGTGLGKGIMVYHKKRKSYESLPSEGGHNNFVIEDDFDIKLVKFLQKKLAKRIIEWEDLLSGRGMSNIYHFLSRSNKSKYSNEIKKSNYSPILISKYKNKDQLAKKTMQLFSKYFGRCTRNYALDILPYGGIYLAGGIAIREPSLVNNNLFRQEFLNHPTQRKILKQLSIYLVKDYRISLYGAAELAKRCIK